MSREEQFLEAGKILNVHGIRGEVKIQPWCDSPEFLMDRDTLYVDGKPLKLLRARMHKGNVLATFEGYDSVEQAETLKNKIVLVDREDAPLPEGKHYIADLIGLEVRDENSGRVIGTLKEVLNYPAQDIFVVKGEKEILIPAVDEFLREIHIEEGWMSVALLKGMADDED